MFKSYLVIKLFNSNYVYYVAESDTPDGALHLAKLHPEYTKHRDYQLSYSRLGDDFKNPIKGLAQFIQGGEIEIWLCPSKEALHFWSALLEWQRMNTDFMRLYWYMKYQELSDQMTVMSDTVEYEKSKAKSEYQRGLADGKKEMESQEEKMAFVMLDTNHKRHTRHDVGTLGFWRDMFVLQTRKINSLTSQTRDSLELVLAISDTSPLSDTSRIELIKKLALQSRKIAMLESELEEMYNVDYGVVVQLVIETALDTTWNNANLVQRERIIETLKGLQNDL